VFLERSNSKKDVFGFKTKYYVVASAEDAKNKLAECLIRKRDVEMSSISGDLERLLEHVEVVLSHKKVQEITKVENYIEDRINYHKQTKDIDFSELRLSSYTPEHINFSQNMTYL
jgi:hypothetical protein